MKNSEDNSLQHLLRSQSYKICTGILSVFFVLALAFFAVFGGPTALAENVLYDSDVFFRVHGYLWITGAVWVFAIFFSRRGRSTR